MRHGYIMFKTMRVAIILSIIMILAACGRQSDHNYETKEHTITEPTPVPVSKVNQPMMIMPQKLLRKLK